MRIPDFIVQAVGDRGLRRAVCSAFFSAHPDTKAQDMAWEWFEGVEVEERRAMPLDNRLVALVFDAGYNLTHPRTYEDVGRRLAGQGYVVMPGSAYTDWTSVEDALPPLGKYVLVYRPGADGVDISQTRSFHGSVPAFPFQGVTHWRELPEEPRI